MAFRRRLWEDDGPAVALVHGGVAVAVADVDIGDVAVGC